MFDIHSPIFGWCLNFSCGAFWQIVWWPQSPGFSGSYLAVVLEDETKPRGRLDRVGGRGRDLVQLRRRLSPSSQAAHWSHLLGGVNNNLPNLGRRRLQKLLVIFGFFLNLFWLNLVNGFIEDSFIHIISSFYLSVFSRLLSGCHVIRGGRLADRRFWSGAGRTTLRERVWSDLASTFLRLTLVFGRRAQFGFRSLQKTWWQCYTEESTFLRWYVLSI